MMYHMPVPLGVVRFRAYRRYEALRVEVSNALMGLLAGAQLSNHLLQLNRGSDRLLPEVYPNVPHIRRFNLTAEAASDILAEADVHLGAMSIAYVLALHEDSLKTCLGRPRGAIPHDWRRATSSGWATVRCCWRSPAPRRSIERATVCCRSGFRETTGSARRSTTH
jgi:hypothetical protein